MVRYFEESLKLSIKAKIDQNAIHLDDYKELVAKAVRAEAKTRLQPSFYMRKMDIQILWGSWPTHTTAHKVQMQGGMNCGEDFKASKAPASTSIQDFNPSNKAKKNKKKKYRKDKRDSKKPKDAITSAIEVSKAEISSKRKKDVSEITYYNFKKKGHYAINFLKSWMSKNLYWFWRPPRWWLMLVKRL